jgi:hypothetical protein
MQMHAAISRLRLAALVGGERGEALRRKADEFAARQEVRNLSALARVFAPGFPD